MHQNNYNLSFESENLVVDFLWFNLQFIDKDEIQEVAEYLSKEYSCNSIFIGYKKIYSLIEKYRFSCKAKFLTSHTKFIHFKELIQKLMLSISRKISYLDIKILLLYQ